MLKESLLPYKRMASLKVWLTKHRVQIFGGENSKRSYVLKEQFHRAQLEERVRNLKQVYGNNWMEVLQSEMQLKAKYQATLDSIQQYKTGHVAELKLNDKGPTQRAFILDINKELKLP